jgi:hypothetical protein
VVLTSNLGLRTKYLKRFVILLSPCSQFLGQYIKISHGCFHRALLSPLSNIYVSFSSISLFPVSYSGIENTTRHENYSILFLIYLIAVVIVFVVVVIVFALHSLCVVCPLSFV